MKNFLTLNFFISIMALTSSSLTAQRTYFPQLRHYKHGAYLLPGSRTYIPYNKIFEESESDPIAYVQIYPGQTEKIVIAYNPGPSDDPNFEFYRQDGQDFTFLFSLDADEIYVPGNGYIYTRQDNVAKKYIYLRNGEAREIKQPFYYLGIKDRTLKPIKVYADRNFTKVLASLPRNYPVEILLGKNCEYGNFCDAYLIKTSFGLVGWIQNDGQSLNFFRGFMAD